MTDPQVLHDLLAEGDELDRLVADLAPVQWTIQTPSPGWTIAHQIAHLAWTDEVTILAATDPAGFHDQIAVAMAHAETYVDDAAAAGALRPDLLEYWRAGRATLITALAGVPDVQKLPWFGPPMSATSMATARLMETWAHGQDVADALGVRRAPTMRLRNVAHIGVRTRDFAHLVNDQPVPGEAFRIELRAPDESLWVWGPENAKQRVTGTALDFCLLVTQRRHRADLDIVAHGGAAQQWLTLAQAFAGAPGAGRPPGQFGVSAR